MPDHSETSTTDLLSTLKLRLQGLLVEVDYSELEEILEERVISEEEDPEVEPSLRGGIRPTRRP